MRNWILLAGLLLNYRVYAQSQPDSLDVLEFDSLKASLRVYYLRKTEAETQEFRFANKFKWLQFVPNVGYDAFRQAPVVTTNLSGVFAGINSKQAVKAKLASIQKVNEVLFNEDLVYIRAKLNELQRRIQAYNSQVELLKIRETKFRITETGYKRKEITPSEYLTAQLDFKGFQAGLDNVREEILILKNEIIVRARATTWESL